MKIKRFVLPIVATMVLTIGVTMLSNWQPTPASAASKSHVQPARAMEIRYQTSTRTAQGELTETPTFEVREVKKNGDFRRVPGKISGSEAAQVPLSQISRAAEGTSELKDERRGTTQITGGNPFTEDFGKLFRCAQCLEKMDGYIGQEVVCGFTGYRIQVAYPGENFHITFTYAPELGYRAPLKTVTLYNDGTVTEKVAVRVTFLDKDPTF